MRFVWLILLASATFAVQVPGAQTVRNGIAAIVNDVVITEGELQDYTADAEELLWRTYRKQPSVYEQKREEARVNGLEDLINKVLILDDFKSGGRLLPDSVIDDEIKERIRRKFGDRVRLTKTLQSQGVTYETFRQRTHDEIIVAYMRQKNISSAILISPQKIEQYYQTNQAQFQLGDQVKLRMIVLSCPTPSAADDIKRMAIEILAKIKDGATFAEMASVYSEGSQRNEGGDWGWRDRKLLKPGLSDVAFSLVPGQHSGIIAIAHNPDESYWIYRYNDQGQLASGKHYSEKDVLLTEKQFQPQPQETDTVLAPHEYYLMLVEDKRVARIRPLEEAREEIEKTLILQERSRLQKAWIERLRAKAFIQYK